MSFTALPSTTNMFLLFFFFKRCHMPQPICWFAHFVFSIAVYVVDWLLVYVGTRKGRSILRSRYCLQKARDSPENRSLPKLHKLRIRSLESIIQKVQRNVAPPSPYFREVCQIFLTYDPTPKTVVEHTEQVAGTVRAIANRKIDLGELKLSQKIWCPKCVKNSPST